jgi:hypothetical protein
VATQPSVNDVCPSTIALVCAGCTACNPFKFSLRVPNNIYLRTYLGTSVDYRTALLLNVHETTVPGYTAHGRTDLAAFPTFLGFLSSLSPVCEPRRVRDRLHLGAFPPPPIPVKPRCGSMVRQLACVVPLTLHESNVVDVSYGAIMVVPPITPTSLRLTTAGERSCPRTGRDEHTVQRRKDDHQGGVSIRVTHVSTRRVALCYLPELAASMPQ